MEIPPIGFSNLLAPLELFLDPQNRIFILYLATSLFLAVLMHLVQQRRGLAADDVSSSPIKFIAPAAVYTHRSAVVDYMYFVTNSILYLFLFTPFYFISSYVSALFTSGLGELFAPSPLFEGQLFEGRKWLAIVVVTVVLALVADFATFLGHFLCHRVRWLWEFHKVHHSAQVLTPISVFRIHPVDDLFTFILSGILVGTADAGIRFFLTPQVTPYLLYGLNVLTFGFFVTGYHLRHSHIWVSYGAFWSKIFISPAQHQIHHSSAKRHWDKNFGFMFAFWDLLFGSLYIPKQREEITFGTGGSDDGEYSSVMRLYLLPFKKIWKGWRT
jgi:sterol desaturase/sphingolipid hydroxylase (fatty acid hydroxylase superfamily)